MSDEHLDVEMFIRVFLDPTPCLDFLIDSERRSTKKSKSSGVGGGEKSPCECVSKMRME